MNRTAMIEKLIDATFDSVLADSDRVWLREILRKGFPGYEQMPSETLEREMQLRGLLQFDDPEPDEEFDDDPDGDEDDEDERAVMLATMVALDRLAVDM